MWVNDEQVLLLARRSGSDFDHVLRMRGLGPRLEAEARERAWRREITSVSVMGGGSYANIVEPPPVRDIKILNVRTGEIQQVWSAYALGAEMMSLSPSARFAYVSYRYISTTPGCNPCTEVRFVLIDLKSLKVHDLSTAYEIEPWFHAWSPDDEKLLISTRARSEFNSDTRLVAIDTETRAVKFFDSRDEAVLTFPSTPSVRIPRATWFGNNQVVYPLSSEDGRLDWVSIDDAGRELVITKSFETVPDQLIAKSSDELFFLLQGKIVAVGLNGSIRDVTSTSVELSAVQQPLRGSAFKQARFLGNLPSLREVPFSINAETEIMFFDEDGDVASRFALPGGNVEILSADVSTIVYLQHGVRKGSAVHTVSRNEQNNTKLFRFNQHLVGLSVTSEPIRVNHSLSGQDDLTSWLYLPPNALVDGSLKYPMIVIPYAGQVYPNDANKIPDTLADPPWRVRRETPTSIQLFTVEGYAVLLPSIPLGPREKAGEPFTELMPFVLNSLDAVFSTGLIDETRVALSGTSYGGYTALAIASQSNRFDAVIVSAAPTNLISSYGQFNISARFAPQSLVPTSRSRSQKRMGSPPWMDPNRYVRNSPIFHVENIETPIMIIQGDLDYVPIQQGEEFYTALSEQNKDVVFLRYWGEGHSIVQPQNQRDMWPRVFKFLEDNGVTPGPKTVH